MSVINIAEYKDKVYGCWAGKNIGGTLGAPFEGKREINEIEFYAQDLGGAPAPNDDLDLQLVWLHAAREHGAANITPRLLGEYWLGVINGPWNEYGVGKANIRAGLFPPLSGSSNNDRWKFSNGAWIRSEIWACLAPGNPDQAIKFAYMDACVDHCGEGIYAEMFTAALEAAAFIVGDIKELVAIGLSKIPADCRVARSVRIAMDHYKKGKSWKEAREALVKASADLGWFQAPANIGFTVVGLLYGEGDLGKTVCRAVNCGDDTDCTGATAGSVLGIIGGRKAIPEKWLSPIGESICKVCVSCFIGYPRTLGELTDRVIETAVQTVRAQKAPLMIEDAPTDISPEWAGQLTKTEEAEKIWAIPPFALTFDLSYIQVIVDYIDGPDFVSGETKPIKVLIKHKNWIYSHKVSLRWRAPEDWQFSPAGADVYVTPAPEETVFSVTPGKMDGGVSYLELEVRCLERSYPEIICVPVQQKGSVNFGWKK
jgi:ADP-ribosylglycohydrolase